MRKLKYKGRLMFSALLKKKTVKKAKILIVEDEPEIANTMAVRFQKNNFKVITAKNGLTGLEKALSERPDIILLDVMMPEMNGIEMLEKMRKNPAGKEIPVIMVTASSNSPDIKRAMASGIEDYVVKPFDLGELTKRIKTLLEKQRYQ